MYLNSTQTAVDLLSVTPSDSTVLNPAARALYVGTGGDVAVVTPEGTTVTIPDVPSGSILPIQASQVRSTNTTASGIVALI